MLHEPRELSLRPNPGALRAIESRLISCCGQVSQRLRLHRFNFIQQRHLSSRNLVKQKILYQQKTGDPARSPVAEIIGQALFLPSSPAWATLINSVKAASSWAAMSAKTLRFTSTFEALSPSINRL